MRTTSKGTLTSQPVRISSMYAFGYQSSSLVLPQTFIPLSVDTSLIVSKNHCSLVASHFFSFPGFNGARHRQISLSLFSQQSRGVVLVK